MMSEPKLGRTNSALDTVPKDLSFSKVIHLEVRGI